MFSIGHLQLKRRLNMPETEAKKTPKERDYTWFVSPGDAHTNEAISKLLPEENFSFHTLEGETAETGLWLCPNHRFITFLRKSKRDAHLDFRIFRKEGNGLIKAWFKPEKTSKASGQ
jgi:hypothetical protein